LEELADALLDAVQPQQEKVRGKQLFVEEVLREVVEGLRLSPGAVRGRGRGSRLNHSSNSVDGM